MTDRHDIQRARRYIVEYGITREQFRANFKPQFVKNNESKFDTAFRFNEGLRIQRESGGRSTPLILTPRAFEKPDKIKRIVIRHRYWRYNLNTHRIVGRWHGKRRREG